VRREGSSSPCVRCSLSGCPYAVTARSSSKKRRGEAVHRLLPVQSPLILRRKHFPPTDKGRNANRFFTLRPWDSGTG
jgi:hypothetical protein